MQPTPRKDLSDAEAQELEKRLKLNPADVERRVQLVKYYFLRRSEKERRLRFGHIKSLIQIAPEHEECGTPFVWLLDEYTPKQFAEVRELWLSHIAAQPNNAEILASAAFFVYWRDFTLFQELLKRAFAIKPTAYWAYSFVQRCWFEVRSDIPNLYKQKIAQDAIKYGNQGLALDEESDYLQLKFYCLENMAYCALYLGDRKTARSFAKRYERLARPAWSRKWLQNSAAIHGLCDLREGAVQSAIKRLLFVEEGHHPKPSTLRLAQELLEAGQRDAVLKFLQKYKVLGVLPEADRWINAIKQGETPSLEKYG